MAGRIGGVAIVQVVVVAELFTGSDVADRHDPDPAILFFCLAVRVAGVVEKHRRAMPIDDGCAVTNAKKVGHGQRLVLHISTILAHPRPCVLNDMGALADRGSGVATGSVDGGRANDQRHLAASIEVSEASWCRAMLTLWNMEPQPGGFLLRQTGVCGPKLGEWVCK